MTTTNPQGAMQGPDALFSLQQSVSQAIQNAQAYGLAQTMGAQINIALMGDSIMSQQNFSTVAPSSVTWGNGVATFTFASNSLRVGNNIRFVGQASDGSNVLNGNWQVATVVSTTQVTVNIPPSLGSGSSVSGSNNVRDSDSYADNGWLFWANAFSGQRFNLIYNGGEGGDAVADMLARMSEITSLKGLIQACFIMIGINDYNRSAAISAAATVTSVTNTVVSGIISACNTLIAAGITPVVMTNLPVTANFSGAANIMLYVTQGNALLKAYAASQPNVILIDACAAVTNPATGFYLGGNSPSPFTFDGLHPMRTAGRSIGQMVADAFGKVKWDGTLLTSSVLDNVSNASPSAHYNIIQNAPWVATGGTVGTGGSGTAAQGWNVLRSAGSGTFVASVPARNFIDDGDNIGFNQRMAITSGGATDVHEARLNLGGDSNFWTRVLAGQVYESRGVIRLQNVQGSGLKQIFAFIFLQFTDAITGFAYSYQMRLWAPSTSETSSLDTGTYPIGYCSTADFRAMVRTRGITIPTNATGQGGIGIRIEYIFGAATAAGNPPMIADMGRWSMPRIA